MRGSLLKKQSRQAEYDRLKALPRVNPGRGAMSDIKTLMRSLTVATKLVG
jgi:hypothetical protein